MSTPRSSKETAIRFCCCRRGIDRMNLHPRLSFAEDGRSTRVARQGRALSPHAASGLRSGRLAAPRADDRNSGEAPRGDRKGLRRSAELRWRPRADIVTCNAAFTDARSGDADQAAACPAEPDPVILPER